jgi:hypothetical protein
MRLCASAATRLAWLAASMVMSVFAVHFDVLMDMAAMLALCATTVLALAGSLGFMLWVAVVVFHRLVAQVHFSLVYTVFRRFRLATGFAMLCMVSHTAVSVMSLAAMCVVMCLMTLHGQSPYEALLMPWM